MKVAVFRKCDATFESHLNIIRQEFGENVGKTELVAII